ncbi:unnamed protein product [Linum tenue]|nr:unnamed protein product [Linum tenue]
MDENKDVEGWYVADSDSEEVAEAEREEDDYAPEGEYDPTCPTVLFSTAEKRSFRRDWRSALVVRGLGRNVPFNLLSPCLHQLWAKHGGLHISDMQNECYLVRFRKKEDYEASISGGPWILGDTYLTVHRWYRGFDPWTAVTKSSMVWVQLPCVPPELFNQVAVMRIAGLIGKSVRVDRATLEGARMKYARVSVEVDLTKPLLSKYKIEGKEYFITYKGLFNVCFDCGRYGQQTHACSMPMQKSTRDHF